MFRFLRDDLMEPDISLGLTLFWFFVSFVVSFVLVSFVLVLLGRLICIGSYEG